MSNKIGFNNFKAFGPQMQYFTKKPITLIYGPNSVGKSSLLHSQLYFEYFKENRQKSNFYNSSFAGDNLDIGGFENFIYKHNLNESLKYEFEITEKKDIFTFLMDIDETLIDLLCNEIDISIPMIEEALNKNYQNTGIKFKYFIEMSVLKSIFIYDSFSKDEKEILKRFASDKKLLIDAMFADSNQNMSLDNFIDLFNKEFQSLGNNASIIEKLLLATKEITVQNIYNTLVFFKYASRLMSIKYKLQLSSNENTIKTVVNFEIENEEVFQHDGTTWKINTKHNIFEYVEKLNRNFNDYIDDHNESSIYNYFHFSLRIIIGKIFALNKIQYYGPLRYYPQRWEMNHIKKEIDELEQSDIDIKKPLELILKSYNFLRDIKNRYESKNLILNALMDLLTVVLRFFLMLIGLIFNKNYRKLMTNSDKMKDIWNQILPERFHFMRKDKLKSNEIWRKLAISKDLLTKINYWLGDENKLKSIYKISIKQEKIYSDQIFFYKLDKILNIENAYFSRTKELKISKILFEKLLYKLVQAFHSVFVFIENKVNTKDKYMNQIVFTDTKKQTEVTPRDMGLGISQMLPILISAMSLKDTKMYVEQPELHLHPAVQMELMDEFIRSHNENNNEFMMESHSEHMLLRVMKRLRQTANGTLKDESLRLTPDDVCLLYINNDGEQTYIQELRLNQTGKLLDHWPNGFFEEGYKERFM